MSLPAVTEFESFKVDIITPNMVINEESSLVLKQCDVITPEQCTSRSATLPSIVSPVGTSSTTDAHEFSVNMTNSTMPFVKNMLAGVILNNVVKCEIEIDTAACHCVLSYSVYKDIVSFFYDIGFPV